MTVVEVLDRLAAWAEENICKKVLIKKPPDDNEAANDAGYEYERVHPACFTTYVPSKDKLPPKIVSPIPSLCVRCVEGKDDMVASARRMKIEFCLSTWETGTYGRDILIPNEKDGLRPKEWRGEESQAYFRRHGEGWRDAWNFIDIVLRELESVGSIDGIALDRSQEITFEPLKEQESIPDYYPFWFAVVSFTVQTGINRNNQDYAKFL